MNCDEIDGLLSDYIDEELEGGVRTSVRRHLDGCERCAASYRSLRRTVRFIQNNADVAIRTGTPADGYMKFQAAISDPDAGRDWTGVVEDEGYGDMFAGGVQR